MSLSSKQRETIDCQRFSRPDQSAPSPTAAASAEESQAASDVLERSQQFDRQIAKTMQSAEPPAGFADRMLAQLLVEEQSTESVASEVVLPADAPPVRSSRRRWVQVAVGFALASSAAALLFMALRVTPASEAEILECASGKDGWVHDVYQTDQWQTDLADAMQVRPLNRVDLQRSPIGWRPYAVQWDEQAVAYDLRRNPFDTPAVLFAIKPAGQAGVEPTSPPLRPQNQTGAWSVAIWGQGDMLYVLAGKGGGAAYRQLIRRPEFTRLLRELDSDGAIAATVTRQSQPGLTDPNG